jgi:hypothetical protein
MANDFKPSLRPIQTVGGRRKGVLLFGPEFMPESRRIGRGRQELEKARQRFMLECWASFTLQESVVIPKTQNKSRDYDLQILVESRCFNIVLNHEKIQTLIQGVIANLSLSFSDHTFMHKNAPYSTLSYVVMAIQCEWTKWCEIKPHQSNFHR